MDDRLKNAYNKLINKHYAAVQTDTALEHTDNRKLEKKAKEFWNQFHEAEKEFEDLLEKCTLENVHG